MSWIIISLASAAITALVSISDKTVIYRYTRSPLTLPLLIGIAQTTAGFIVIGLTGFPKDVSLAAGLSAFLSGMLFGLSAILSQKVLFTQEVSRTIPITQSSPIFAAVLAILLLGESISLLQWLGIIATVVGSASLSFRTGRGTGNISLDRSFYVLMLSAFLFGAANVVGKAAVDELPVLFTHGLRSLALGLVFLLFSVRSAPWADVKGYFLGRSPALILVGINEFITAQIGIVLLLWALSMGPAALVSALLGTRAGFVLLFSTTVALVWPGALGEEITPSVLTVKVVSTALIVIGVIAVVI